MRREKPHPLLLIVFLLGISAFITGCETFASYRSTVKPKENRAEMQKKAVETHLKEQRSPSSAVI